MDPGLGTVLSRLYNFDIWKSFHFCLMEKLVIATAQFEHRSGDKTYNLDTIEQLTANAAQKGASVIAFHECSVTGYTFARKLSQNANAGPG